MKTLIINMIREVRLRNKTYYMSCEPPWLLPESCKLDRHIQKVMEPLSSFIPSTLHCIVFAHEFFLDFISFLESLLVLMYDRVYLSCFYFFVYVYICFYVCVFIRTVSVIYHLGVFYLKLMYS